MKQNGSLALCLLFFISFYSTTLLSAEGLITVKSNNNVQLTSSKLERLLKARGITLFEHISHSDGATAVGQQLHESEVLIFGSPKLGTPLMHCAPQLGLDLPLRILISEINGEVLVSYNDPDYLKTRYQIKGCEAELEKMAKLLKELSMQITR